MYFKQVVKMDYSTNSMNTAKFKFVSEKYDLTPTCLMEGKIHQVGIDYVNILLDNNDLVTILTDRISKIVWLDPNYTGICRKCHHHKCRCVKLNRGYDENFELDEHCEDCGNNPDDCFPKCTCYCDFAIPFCDDKFKLRLAGLTHGVNWELFRHIGCRVKLEIKAEE
ncbi:hypothetical protein [Sutcliffiella horikoshii]|uniref:hypothetical protein n=1 Tax=Sutcliffiella horikoshii TaxID=79883 RepID=UPI001CFD3953|nr:hypothetical protein [Sutcliffiella horikoshii]